jgi:septum formation protein
VLASTSQWRLELLIGAGLPFRAVDPGVDEALVVAPAPGGPQEVALARAEAKALAVARRMRSALVVGADQVAHLDGEQFGKPLNAADHLSRLKSLRGRRHELTTGVVVMGPGELDVERLVVTSGVRFRSDLLDGELAAYVASGEGSGCAGGYMVERRGAWLVEEVDGDWLNVIGLPVFPLVGLLRRRGLRLGSG